MIKNSRKLSQATIPDSLLAQLKKSSKDHGTNVFVYFFKRLLNYLLEVLAFHIPSSSWRVKFHKWRGVHVGKHVSIGRGCVLDHAYPEYIFLEDYVALTGDVYILAHTTTLDHFSSNLQAQVAPVVIKRGAFVGIRATILPGVTIGEEAIISAGAIIQSDVPPRTVVAPAGNRRIPLV